MITVAHSLSVIFLHPTVATLFAFAGIALGIALRKIALHRLSLMVAAAMGTLLAVTLFDVLPDAKQFLTWPTFFLPVPADIFSCGPSANMSTMSVRLAQ